MLKRNNKFAAKRVSLKKKIKKRMSWGVVLGVLAGIFLVSVSLISRTSDQPTSESKPLWTLKKKTLFGKNSILTLPDENTYLIRWGDNIFYGEGNYSKNVHIFSINLKTGKKKVVYNLEASGDLVMRYKNGTFPERYVRYMQIIDDKLFFSIGGFLNGGVTYWYQLPPDGEPQKIIGVENGYIKYWKGYYWLINGEGDGCGGYEKYYLMDMKKMKATYIATWDLGCGSKNIILGIDSRNRMLIANHEEYIDMVNNVAWFNYVQAIPLENPEDKIMIINKSMMPKQINSIRYSEENDQLILQGYNNYYFDFKTNKINILNKDQILPTPTPAVQYVEGYSLLKTIQSIKLPQGYEFVLE